MNRWHEASTSRTLLLGLCAVAIALSLSLGGKALATKSAFVAAQVSPPISPLPAAEPATEAGPATSFRLPVFGESDSPIGLWRAVVVMAAIVAVVGVAIWRERE